jgi:GxxExxY protein
MHEALTRAILKAFYEVYNELGQGFLESVYENALALVMGTAGLQVERQVAVPVWFRGWQVGDFRADLLVGGCVLVELKAGWALEPVHEAQLLNYLRATDVELGLLLLFGPQPMVKRPAFDNARKTRHSMT